MKKYRPIILVALWVFVLGFAGWFLVKDVDFAVLSPTGQIAKEQRNLLLFTVGLSVLVVVPVFAMLGLFAWKYREGARAAYLPEWSHSVKLEILWWGIPIVIIALLSVITWKTSHTLDPYRPIESTKETLEVQVVALQWKWLFIYPQHKIATVNDLTIPVDTPVRFSLTADAPMSAFWIPSLGSQIYSMNAMSSQVNLIGNQIGMFKGYNTNINGEGYAKMVFDTRVVSEGDFASWYKKHAKSGHKLSTHHFEELAEPNIVSEPMYMSLTDEDIYDKIVMKYMGADHEKADANATEGAKH